MKRWPVGAGLALLVLMIASSLGWAVASAGDEVDDRRSVLEKREDWAGTTTVVDAVWVKDSGEYELLPFSWTTSAVYAIEADGGRVFIEDRFSSRGRKPAANPRSIQMRVDRDDLAAAAAAGTSDASNPVEFDTLEVIEHGRDLPSAEEVVQLARDDLDRQTAMLRVLNVVRWVAVGVGALAVGLVSWRWSFAGSRGVRSPSFDDLDRSARSWELPIAMTIGTVFVVVQLGARPIYPAAAALIIGTAVVWREVGALQRLRRAGPGLVTRQRRAEAVIARAVAVFPGAVVLLFALLYVPAGADPDQPLLPYLGLLAVLAAWFGSGPLTAALQLSVPQAATASPTAVSR